MGIKEKEAERRSFVEEIIGKDTKEESAEKNEEIPAAETIEKTEPEKEVEVQIIPEEEKEPKKKCYLERKYYLTEEIVEAIERKAYFDKSLDKSGHVRAALELYLSEDMRILKEEKEK